MVDIQNLLVEFMVFMGVSEPFKAAEVLRTIGVDNPQVLPLIEGKGRDEMEAKLQEAQLSIGDRAKIKGVKESDVDKWICTKTDVPPENCVHAGAAHFCTACAATIPKVVVKETQEILNVVDLWRRDIDKSACECIEVAARKARDAIADHVAAINQRNAQLCAVVSQVDSMIESDGKTCDAAVVNLDGQFRTVMEAMEAMESNIASMRQALTFAIETRKRILAQQIQGMRLGHEMQLKKYRSVVAEGISQNKKAADVANAAIKQCDETAVRLRPDVIADIFQFDMPPTYILKVLKPKAVVEYEVKANLALVSDLLSTFVAEVDLECTMETSTFRKLFLPEFVEGTRVFVETEIPGQYRADNSQLQSSSHAVDYRNSKMFEDRFHTVDGVKWGSLVEGVLTDGWLEVYRHE